MSLTSISPHIIERITALYKVSAGGVVDRRQQEADQPHVVVERQPAHLAHRDLLGVGGEDVEVRGQLRTYKIHLGSGNILMSPNDEYLCIVPARSAADPGVFLPFEGDGTLSVIINRYLVENNWSSPAMCSSSGLAMPR